MITLKKDMRILFTGDSITDGGREGGADDKHMGPLGLWYVNFIASRMMFRYPELNLSFFNTGFCGDRIDQLKARWQRDCIDLKPDLVTILIGINDTWSRYTQKRITTIDSFEKDYRDVIREAQEKCRAQIVIMEPFLIENCADHKLWREDLNPKIDVARRVAREAGAIYIPLDGIFASACCTAQPQYWSGDGIHPGHAGHALIAQSWINHVLGRDAA